MLNAIWKGHISFGLVSIPIILYSSEDKSTNISFHQIDKRNNARIKYKRINTENGKEVPWEEIGKAYQFDKDQIIPVEEGELEKVAGENAQTIAIEAFVDKKNLDFIMINKTYYLVPDKKGDKGYVILREALNNSNKIGIAKIIISSKEYLAAVATSQNALVIYTLRYADEIKSVGSFPIPSENIAKYKVNKKELDIAEQLIKSMTTKWNPEQYKDEFKDEVEKWLNNKLKKLPSKAMKRRSAAAPATNVINFIDLLKKSIKPKKGAKNDSKYITKHKKRKTVRAK